MLQRLMKPFKKKQKNQKPPLPSTSPTGINIQGNAEKSENIKTIDQFQMSTNKSLQQIANNNEFGEKYDHSHTQSSPAFKTVDNIAANCSNVEEGKAFIPSPGGISVLNKEEATRPANINNYNHHPSSQTQSVPILLPTDLKQFEYPDRNTMTDGVVNIDDAQTLKSLPIVNKGEVMKTQEDDDDEEDPQEQEKNLYKYLLEQQNLPKLMRGSVRKSWMDAIDNPTEQALQTTIKDMKRVIQDLQTKDSSVKKQIEQFENQKQNLAKNIFHTDIEIEKSEKGRQLDNKYLFKQDQVLIKMQQNAEQDKAKKSKTKRQQQNRKGLSQLSEPGKSTIQSKIKPSVVSTRPDPSLMKSNKVLTSKVDQIEQQINMLISQFIQNQQKTEPKLKKINENLLSQKMVSSDKILKALSGQIRIAGKSYQSTYKSAMNTMQKGKNDLEEDINELKSEQERFLLLKRDCIQDKKQLFNHEREIGEYKVDFMIREERGLNSEDDANDDQKLEHAYAASSILAKLKKRYSRVENSDMEDETFIEKLPNYGEVMSSDSISQILKKNFHA